MICKSCGTWNPDEYLLCEKCGDVLDPSKLAGAVVDALEDVTGEKYNGDSITLMGKDVNIARRDKYRTPTSAVSILGGNS